MMGRESRQRAMEAAMKCRIVAWAAVFWIAVCLGPYLYAASDLIAWR